MGAPVPQSLLELLARSRGARGPRLVQSLAAGEVPGVREGAVQPGAEGVPVGCQDEADQAMEWTHP